MEVLLTFENSRRVIIVPEDSSLLAAIESDLAQRFPDRDISLAAGAGLSIPKSSTKDVHIIQRRTEKWGFVDVTDVSQVRSGDEITLVKIAMRGPGESSSRKDPHQEATKVLSSVKRPTQFETAVLGDVFRASSSSSKLPSTFDPTRECVFAEQKRKKCARVKPSKLTLTLLTGKESSIPRGKHRKALETKGRIQKVEFSRDMSAATVKNLIIRAFCHQEDFNSTYRLLCQSQDGKLSTNSVQFPSGDQFVEGALKHRGNVYLVPVDEAVPTSQAQERGVESGSSSDDPELPKTVFARKRKVAGTGRGTPLSAAAAAGDLSEWRRVRSEQDEAYEQSLHCDQQKDKEAAERQQLEKERSDKTVALRALFASRRVCQHLFPQDLPKVLYKYVASLDTVTPFLLKTASSHPETVEYSSTSPVGSLHLSTLIVEVCADGPPLFSLLEEVRLPGETLLRECRRSRP